MTDLCNRFVKISYEECVGNIIEHAISRLLVKVVKFRNYSVQFSYNLNLFLIVKLKSF